MNFKHNWSVKFRTWSWLDFSKLSLLVLIILSFSLNLFKKFILPGAYLDGLLIDYLLPKFYLVDIFLLFFLILEWRFWPKIKEHPWFYLWLFGLAIRQVFTPEPIVALLSLGRLTAWLGFIAVMQKDPFLQQTEVRQISLGAILSQIIGQSLLAIYQFLWQKPLLPYQFLGETRLLDLANVSRAQFWWAEKILPYGSTAHPNILAGMVVLTSLLVLQVKAWPLWFKVLLVINLAAIIFITQSMSALLTVALFLLYQYFFKNKKTPSKNILVAGVFLFFIVFLPFLLEIAAQKNPSDSIQRRVKLNQAAWQMWQAKPLFGVGLNQFTYYLEQFGPNKEVVRFIQPVHHLFLLILSEGGMYLLWGLFYLLRKAAKTTFLSKAIVLLAIISLDHYLWTQVAGLALFSWFYLFF